MYDFTGDMSPFQKMLDDAGIKFDVTFLCGLTRNEIFGYVKWLISLKERGEDIENYLPIEG